MTDKTVYIENTNTGEQVPTLYRLNADGVTYSPVSQPGSGAAGGSCVPVSVTFIRPANATGYTAKDNIGVTLTVTGATNASPIVVTTEAHGLADGDPVTLANVGGNTNANGSYFAKVTGYTTLTFALYTDKALTTPRAGNSNYTNSGTVGRLFRLPNIFQVAGGSGYITKIRVMTNTVAFLDQLKLHFYNSPVIALEDHAALTLLYANVAARVGFSTLPTLATEAAGSDASSAIATIGDGVSNLPLFVQNGETIPGRDLYFRLETLGTGTPGNAGSITVEVTVDNNPS